MIAPNKVYIFPSQYNLQYDNGGEAYIRKEALLEWAKDTEKSRMRVPIEAYNNEDYQAGFIDGFAKFRRSLIEKLESL